MRTSGAISGGSNFIAWAPSFIEGNPAEIYQPAVLCGLPGKSTLQYIGINYNEDVGS